MTEKTAHKHSFPVQPPRGSWSSPGPCECGKPWARSQAETLLGDAAAAMNATEPADARLATEKTPGQAAHTAFIDARFPHLDRADLAWQEFTDEQRAAWEAAANAAIDAVHAERDRMDARVGELERERDEARAIINEQDLGELSLKIEREQLADHGRMLGRVVSMQLRTLMAAWIDAERGDLDAAKETIAQVIENVPELEPWNGTETGIQWLERTRAAQERP